MNHIQWVCLLPLTDETRHILNRETFAAMPPAMAIVGKLANNIGTTSAPSVVRLPHHKAASQGDKAWIRAASSVISGS